MKLSERDVPNKKIRACIQAMIDSSGPLAQTSWPRFSSQWPERIKTFKAADAKKTNGKS